MKFCNKAALAMCVVYKEKTVKIQFDDNLDYPTDAVRAVIGLFRGQPPNPEEHSPQFAIKSSASFREKLNDLGTDKCLLLSDDKILKNLQSAQRKNGLPVDEEFKEGKFFIEMETSKGKTYVYLRTIIEALCMLHASPTTSIPDNGKEI